MSEMLLERRLDRLEDRVLRVERNLGLAALPPPEPITTPRPARVAETPSESRLDDLVEMRRQARERQDQGFRPAMASTAPPPLPKPPPPIFARRAIFSRCRFASRM